MDTTKLHVIITGATGMVGEGVLHVALQDPQVASVLSLTRKPTGVVHPKLKELIHPDFLDLLPVEQELRGYNACFFCLGVSSVGMNKDDYYRFTYTLTMHVAQTLSRLNKGMTFCYISGAGTDSSEQGRISWARVKGKTENDLIKLPFRAVYNFRPGFIKPIKGLRHTHAFYKFILWLFPVGRAFFPGGFCTLPELAQAMIRTAANGFSRQVLEGKDIIALGKQEGVK